MSRMGRDELLPVSTIPASNLGDRSPRPRSPQDSRSGALIKRSAGNGKSSYKRLIVACDGTWLNSDDGMQNGELAIPSNVTRLSRAIKAESDDGIPQVVYYHYGVGSQGGILDRVVMGKFFFLLSTAHSLSWNSLSSLPHIALF
jgi:uncharacterized protein (DUF2235 family)